MWKPAAKILGGSGPVLYRFFQAHATNEYLVGMPELAFAHFRRRFDGFNTLYEIAVDPSVKRQGLGSKLLQYVGYPMELKTDADNLESNSFYQRLGFHQVGTKQGKQKMFNLYRKL